MAKATYEVERQRMRQRFPRGAQFMWKRYKLKVIGYRVHMNEIVIRWEINKAVGQMSYHSAVRSWKRVAC